MWWKSRLVVLIAVLSLVAGPASAYKVSQIGGSIDSEALDSIQPMLVKNVVKKMSEHGVSANDIRTITIDAGGRGGEFSGAEVWVKTKSGGSYLLDANASGGIFSVDKRK